MGQEELGGYELPRGYQHNPYPVISGSGKVAIIGTFHEPLGSRTVIEFHGQFVEASAAAPQDVIQIAA